MDWFKIRPGDIVVDTTFKFRSHAVVLWGGFNGQPLLTGPEMYRPYWGTYEKIQEVIGHIDLEKLIEKAVDDYQKRDDKYVVYNIEPN